MISIKRPSSVYYSSYKKLDLNYDSETLVPSQQTTDFVTEKNKIRIFAAL
jgi:hypothetical protein